MLDKSMIILNFPIEVPIAINLREILCFNCYKLNRGHFRLTLKSELRLNLLNYKNVHDRYQTQYSIFKLYIQKYREECISSEFNSESSEWYWLFSFQG